MKELIIKVPEGMEIDKEHSTFEKIVFKKKENKRPTKWMEVKSPMFGWYVDADSTIVSTDEIDNNDLDVNYYNRNIWPTKELAEASLAICQLVRLRNEWVGDWEPDWKDIRNFKYIIVALEGKASTSMNTNVYGVLSFPTTEMIHDFINTFNDLLETAKPLL